MRVGVPASVATLRWSDYLAVNATPRLMRDAVADLGNPTEWLATDQPVPFRLVRSIEVWYRDEWVEVSNVPDDAFDRYLELDG